ncbi:MAG: BT0820 family HAD-type phosphatase [Bacteroidales bacterium]
MEIAVDFDGTIVKHRYPEIGEEIPFAIETLRLIQSELKHNLILWTVREGVLLEQAVDFCRQRGLVFYAVNSNHPEEGPGASPRKIMADMFIDDRNFGGLPDWGFIYNSLKNNPEKCLTIDIFHNSLPSPKPQKKGLFR